MTKNISFVQKANCDIIRECEVWHCEREREMKTELFFITRLWWRSWVEGFSTFLCLFSRLSRPLWPTKGRFVLDLYHWWRPIRRWNRRRRRKPASFWWQSSACCWRCWSCWPCCCCFRKTASLAGEAWTVGWSCRFDCCRRCCRRCRPQMKAIVWLVGWNWSLFPEKKKNIKFKHRVNSLKCSWSISKCHQGC